MSRPRAELRILIADDHPMYRLGLAMALRSLGFGQVDEAIDGQHAADLAHGRAYDVVLLDLRMPRLNGVDAARRIVGSVPDGRPTPVIIMLSTFEEPAVVAAAAGAGATAFLGKETEPEHLARRIDELVGSEARRLQPPSDLPDLSPREFEVLRRLVTGATGKAIAAELGISPETVKHHVNRLYAKLGVSDRVSAVQAARKYGWVVLDEIQANGNQTF